MPTDLLAIYLRDHHAAATALVQVAKRCRSSNPEGELGAFLERLVAELDDDRRELERAMRELGVSPSRSKDVGALVAERVGRLKLNGRLREYSPLSRLFELQGLLLGAELRLAAWRALEDSGRLGAGWTETIAGLRERAEAQRAELERHRSAAARVALA